jgi:hypothetical protein
MFAAGRTPKNGGGGQGCPGPLALAGPLWELDWRVDLSRPNARIVSLIEINLRQFRFVVTFIRVRAC